MAVLIIPIISAYELVLALLYKMHESIAMGALLLVVFGVLSVRPRKQCSRMLLYVVMIVTSTLSWTAWSARLFILNYHDGNALLGICMADSEINESLQNLVSSVTST